MNTTITGQGGKRQFETDCLENDFLSSSEDTAVGLDHSILHPHPPPPLGKVKIQGEGGVLKGRFWMGICVGTRS